MKRPKINIELEPIDRVIELIGFIALLILIGLPLYYYQKLPDTIPTHFGANGEPDGYSGKNMLWLMPILGTVMFVGMYWLNKVPHIFNYPQEVTQENAQRLYTMATRMIRSLNALMTSFFAYMTFSTIHTALGNSSGLGVWFAPVFIAVTLGVTGYFVYRSSQAKNKAADNK